MSPACSHTSLLRTSKYGPSHRLVELPPVRQCIGQSSLQPHPYVKMGGSAGGLSLYKAGCLGSCSKHLTHDHSHRRAEAFGPSTAVAAASASKPNSPALCSPHLSESEMATFVSVSFQFLQHWMLSAARVRPADLCTGGLFEPCAI